MTLQVRLASHINLSNPLVDEVKQNYSDVFFMTKEILANMELFSQATISDDEIVYVCLHSWLLSNVEKKTINFQYWRFVRQDLELLKCLKIVLNLSLGIV